MFCSNLVAITGLQYYLPESTVKINYCFQCVKKTVFQQKSSGNNRVLCLFNRKLMNSLFFLIYRTLKILLGNSGENSL